MRAIRDPLVCSSTSRWKIVIPEFSIVSRKLETFRSFRCNSARRESETRGLCAHEQLFNAVLTRVTLDMYVRYIAPHGNMHGMAILRPGTLVNSRGRTLLETNCVIPPSAVIRRSLNLYYCHTCVRLVFYIKLYATCAHARVYAISSAIIVE